MIVIDYAIIIDIDIRHYYADTYIIDSLRFDIDYYSHFIDYSLLIYYYYAIIFIDIIDIIDLIDY